MKMLVAALDAQNRIPHHTVDALPQWQIDQILRDAIDGTQNEAEALQVAQEGLAAHWTPSPDVQVTFASFFCERTVINIC